MHYIVNIYHIQIGIIYILLVKVESKNVVENISEILVGWVLMRNISKCAEIKV